jgi:acetyl esterase/lipase
VSNRALPLVLLLPVLGLPAASPSRAGDATKAAVKTGAHFEVKVIRDVPYEKGEDADARSHSLDLYLPKGQKDFPALVFIHGGGWTGGDKQGAAGLGRVLARNGVGVASVNYRLSPAVKHPAHIQDVARAFAWVCGHIADYGGRPDRVFVSGHSAGGRLAALLATDDTYLKAEKWSLADVRGAIPISGVYTIRPGRLSKVFGSDEEVCRQASPLAHVREGLPPFLILYADQDFPGCDRMSEAMGKALRKSGCEASCLEIKDRNHGSIAGNLAHQDDPGTQAILEFIARHSELKLTRK